MSSPAFFQWVPVAALLALAGCGGAAADGEWNDARVERHYEDDYQRWTRAGNAYEYFEGRAFVHATFWSPPFATSLARYESVRFGHLPGAAKAHMAEREAQAGSELRFLVTLVTQTPYWNDLDRPGATFTVKLLRGGVAIAPTSVARVSLDTAEDLVHFYPHVDPLGTAYWVTFPKVEGEAWPVLRIAGAPARIDLDWASK